MAGTINLKTMTQKIILTGATGMVGEGVLLECLRNPQVSEVLALSRKPSGHTHPKLREVLHADFQNLSSIENELTGYDACLFCAGISSLGVSKPEYERITHDLTLHVAETVLRLNPDSSFGYISGAGTDSTETSFQHWARVKGRTENELLAMPFRHVHAFRPGMMKPEPEQLHVLAMYKPLGWLFPAFRALGMGCSIREVAQAMLRASAQGYFRPVLEISDIVALAQDAEAAAK